MRGTETVVVTRLGRGPGDVVVPAAGLRWSAVALVVLVVGAPWLALRGGLFTSDVGATGPGERIRLRPELVVVPAGRFTMGSPVDEAGRADDETQREVEVDAFALCRTEVTNGQWEAVIGTRACEGCDEDQPVHGVTWEQATAYLDALTDRENVLMAATGEAPRTRCHAGGRAVPGCTGYRLPTDAEWEYAARAGTQTAFSFGEDPRALCRFGNGADQTACDDGFADVAAVASLEANAWGLHDVHGNVAEWVVTGNGVRLRGGSFRDPPRALRSAASAAAAADAGLRCARQADPGQAAPADGAIRDAISEDRPIVPPEAPLPTVDHLDGAATDSDRAATDSDRDATDSDRGAAAVKTGKRGPTVRLGKTEILGTLDKDIVRRILRAKIEEVRACYVEALTRDPKASGSVTIQFTISGAGKVPSAVAQASTLADPTVGDCIARAVRRRTFPKPAGGRSVVVIHPYILEPG